MIIVNHYKMGRLICRKMAENDMPLNKPLFLLGNLAPDLFLSYVYRAHMRATAGSYVERLMGRLYNGDIAPDRVRFYFYLGVITHYVCDFFCYPHTPAFSGGTYAHFRYEERQKVRESDILPFDKQESMGLSLKRLTDKLGGYISSREELLAQNADTTADSEISVAMNTAMWAASAVYIHAESLAAGQKADMMEGERLTAKMAG